MSGCGSAFAGSKSGTMTWSSVTALLDPTGTAARHERCEKSRDTYRVFIVLTDSRRQKRVDAWSDQACSGDGFELPIAHAH
ncbi:hypothetical protein BH23CHL5_BH23CHL5_03080 [soil metagenome]